MLGLTSNYPVKLFDKQLRDDEPQANALDVDSCFLIFYTPEQFEKFFLVLILDSKSVVGDCDSNKLRILLLNFD